MFRLRKPIAWNFDKKLRLLVRKIIGLRGTRAADLQVIKAFVHSIRWSYLLIGAGVFWQTSIELVSCSNTAKNTNNLATPAPGWAFIFIWFCSRIGLCVEMQTNIIVIFIYDRSCSLVLKMWLCSLYNIYVNDGSIGTSSHSAWNQPLVFRIISYKKIKVL